MNRASEKVASQSRISIGILDRGSRTWVGWTVVEQGLAKEEEVLSRGGTVAR